jgi:glycosyltransferase involved in cell wall biosynthesis
MKILFVTDTIDCWKHGIWWHRQQMPSQALSMRGHGIKQVAMGTEFPEHLLEWPDTVIFGRAYASHFDPIKWMKEYKKRGKRVLYDMDDDFWQVAKDNPSVLVSNAMKDQYEGMIKEADAVITPSTVLMKKFKKHFKKPVFLCPNAIDTDFYRERPHEQRDVPIIGYMGASSHWKDLQLIGEVLSKLAEKYDFMFSMYGLVGEPFEAMAYAYKKILADNTQPEKAEYFKSALKFYEQLNGVKMWHTPFMPPELHPTVLSKCDFDIGLAPLEDTVFNRGKSCVKFYEYAGVGTVTIASDVLPYSEEVNYRAKNTFKDWYNKIEKLLMNRALRDKVLKEQREYVLKHRTTEAIGLPWELACQKPGGLKVANQE